MSKRTLIISLFCAACLGLTISTPAQITDATTTPPADTPGATPPPLATPDPPITPPAPDLNPPMPAMQGANVTGQVQEIPAGVASPGRVETAPGSCPCSITTPKNHPPVGGCHC
jgi:hypothetical protein